MPLDYTQRNSLIANTATRDRMARAIAKTASFVNAGGTGVTMLAVHKRAVIAEANPGSEINVFMEILAQTTDVTTPASITDAAIQTIVDSNYQRVWGSGL